MLLLTAFIWGIAFVAQSVGMDYVGPFTFNACRFMLGGFVLIPCIYLLNRMSGQKKDPAKRKRSIRGGIFCGLCLFSASTFQQIGIMTTTVGKAGFITALYIVIVPLLGIFMGKKIGAVVWFSVAVATVGMYLLCITEGFRIGTGDICVMVCAVLFSLHILVIDHFSPQAEGTVISCVQFFTAGVLSFVFMFFRETPTVSSILGAAAPILYAGCLSCGVAYTLQVIAQAETDPVLASLICSLESVFSLLAGWVILGQKLSARELIGCVLVFAAILMVQLLPTEGTK